MKYAFVYARMTSRRLPGKPLLDVGGEPLVGRVVRRVSVVCPVVLLTSHDASDDPLSDWAAVRGVPCVRGDLDDVASRTVQAIREWPCDAFFRVNGDSPFVLAGLLRQAGQMWDVTPGLDVLSNVIARTYPYGLAVELVRASTFADAVPGMTRTEREHITAHFYARPGQFRFASLTHERDWSARRLVIDTPEDLRWIRRVIAEQPESEVWDVDELAERLPWVSEPGG